MTETAAPRRPRPWLIPGVVIVVIALAVGLYLFQPWRAFTNRTVIEALPSVEAAPPAAPATATSPTSTPSPLSPATSPASSATPPAPSTPPPAPAAPPPAPAAAPPAPAAAQESPPPAVPAEITELATGSLISHEHGTSGTVSLLQLADGTQIVRLTGLDTSDGPDLRVWLTDAPVIEGRDGWFVFDDGRHVDLGALKGNQGDQNYVVPAGTDLEDLRSVSIWCQRFAVSFGAAELRSAA